MNYSYDESENERSSETSPLLDYQKTLYNERNLGSPFFSSSISIVSCAVMCILFTEFCERLTYYGITGNLVLFATDENQLNFTSSTASIILYVFQGRFTFNVAHKTRSHSGAG